MDGTDSLIYACRLDGKGGAQTLDWHALHLTDPPSGVVWVQLRLDDPDSRDWLDRTSGLDEVVRHALMAEETRPRCLPLEEGLLLNLRGVNLNPGADPEDMVSIRLRLDAKRIISVQRRPLLATASLLEAIARGKGPKNVAEFLVQFSDHLANDMEPVVYDLEDRVDELEDRLAAGGNGVLRDELGVLRGKAIVLRRYLMPQREAYARLVSEELSWLHRHERQRLREVADRMTRYVENLDSSRDRASVLQDTLDSRTSVQMNRTMYMLSIVAGIFLPLSLITSLLGINVAGIPLSEHPLAFAAVCLLLVLVAIFELWLLRRLKLF